MLASKHSVKFTMPGYINFDRQNDALVSLAMTCDAVEKASTDLRYWKHAIVAAHNSLQGFICISISDGNSLLTLKKQHMKKWIKAYENDDDYPETQLDYFMELFDKRFSPESGVIRDSINWLNDTRNMFIHFNIDSYGVCHHSAHNCVSEAIKAIKLTPTMARGIFFYEESQGEEFGFLCKRAEALLNAYVPE
jgi:hypothetical protein